MQGAMICGADFSKWDGGGFPYVTMDWDQYTWGYAFIKVSEGTVIDPLFARQWEAARGKAARGAYHYFRASVEPKLAVEKLLYFMEDDPGEMPVALDLETFDAQPAAAVLDRAHTWLDEYRRLTGNDALIYSSTYFLRDVLKAQGATWLAASPLWLAQYPFDNMSEPARSQKIHDVLTGVSTVTFPAPPAPFKGVSFWQWTAKGNPADVPGYYTGNGQKLSVDLNFYNGNRDQFMIEFGVYPGGKLPETEPPADVWTLVEPGGKVRKFTEVQ
jgi:GH25 family lysozyme M1 (1,4-beta-N-acetylmuramidase)